MSQRYSTPMSACVKENDLNSATSKARAHKSKKAQLCYWTPESTVCIWEQMINILGLISFTALRIIYFLNIFFFLGSSLSVNDFYM